MYSPVFFSSHGGEEGLVGHLFPKNLAQLSRHSLELQGWFGVLQLGDMVQGGLDLEEKREELELLGWVPQGQMVGGQQE